MGGDHLNEEDAFPLTSILKREVRDAEDREIGHVQDLAMDMTSKPPAVSELAVHLDWTDRIGELILPRPTEDIVLLLPWSEVESLDQGELRLRHPHPLFDVISSADKTFARRDILNKQIVDEEGVRLQRVDDVLMRQEGILIFLEGLQVGTEWLPAGSKIGKLVSKLRRRYNRPDETNIIPYEAIMRVDEEVLVIRT
jgi:sporulation protein YlmC with PRC-barrel domain